MALTLASQILQQSPRNLTLPIGRPGMLARGGDGCSIGSAKNAGIKTSQSTVITFPAPGTLPVGAEVFINIVEDNCTTYQIRLHSCDTAAPASLSALLMSALNGTTTPGALTLPGVIPDYSATAPAVTNAPVTIIGKPGVKFTVSFAAFGATVNGIANPPVPTQALSATATCSGAIYQGTAIVNNIQVVSAARTNLLKSVAPEYESLVMSPTNHPLERFQGWVCEDPFQEIQVASCCEPLNCDKPLDCNDCIHFTETCCDARDIFLQLEPFDPGASVPASLVGFSLYYRHTLAAGYTKLGAPAVQLGAPTGQHSLAQDKGGSFQWVIKEVVDPASGLILAGVAK